MSENLNPTGFAAMRLPEPLQRALDRAGFVTPTPIQAEAIPAARSGRDLVGIAQTGTGKTLAFALPILERLLANDGVALVLAPTRELALQIDETFRKLTVGLNLRSAVLIGGAPMNRQVSQLRGRPRIVIATPGRLKDHMSQRTLTLANVGVAVLDEADRMLDLGFAPVVREILAATPANRQTMLFSATMPDAIADLSERFMKDPLRVEVAPAGRTADRVEQELHVVDKDDKHGLLERLLGEDAGTVLVFARTRHGARKLAKAVRDMGHSAGELHSDRTLAQRRAALDGFKSGETRVLVATDIASRGIDVKAIRLVVNFDLPDNPEDYVHRIGRTARAGESGRAITFAMPDQARDVRAIERLIGNAIPRVGEPNAAFEAGYAPRPPRGPGRQGGNSRPSYRDRRPRQEGSEPRPNEAPNGGDGTAPFNRFIKHRGPASGNGPDRGPRPNPGGAPGGAGHGRPQGGKGSDAAKGHWPNSPETKPSRPGGDGRFAPRKPSFPKGGAKPGAPNSGAPKFGKPRKRG